MTYQSPYNDYVAEEIAKAEARLREAQEKAARERELRRAREANWIGRLPAMPRVCSREPRVRREPQASRPLMPLPEGERIAAPARVHPDWHLSPQEAEVYLMMVRRGYPSAAALCMDWLGRQDAIALTRVYNMLSRLRLKLAAFNIVVPRRVTRREPLGQIYGVRP